MAKILRIVFVILIIIFSINSFSYSASIKGDADDFLRAAEETPDSQNMNQGINDIAGVLTGIGVGLIVIVGVILGIQFMLASTEGQAKIKQAMIPYAIGSIVIFGAFGIWKVVIDILNAST